MNIEIQDDIYPMQIDLTTNIEYPMQIDLTLDVAQPMHVDSSNTEQSFVAMNAINMVLNWISVAAITDVVQPMQLDASAPGPCLVLMRSTN